MTKLEIEAIKKLPEKYTIDGTVFALVTPKNYPAMVLAINRDLPAIFYSEMGGWKEALKAAGVINETN